MFGLVPFKTHGVKGSEDAFENFLDGFFNDDFNTKFKFKADIKEATDKYELEAELPGVKKEDIYLEYNDGYLVVGGKREDVSEEKKDNYIKKERHYGEFSRNFRLDNVNEKEISAKFENGVLHVTLPKIEKKSKDESNRIPIE